MIKQRKKLFSLVLVVMMVVLCVTGCSQSSPSEEEEMSSTEDSRTEKTKDSTSTKDDSKEPDEGEEEKTAINALDKLLSGNSAYVSGNINPNVDANLREDLVTNGQHPYAVVITCSDSRVPPELIFNAGLGEVFVIRTAGNVVSDFEIGSVEYGVEHLGSPLVIVLGHTNCGAVTAAVEGGEAGGDGAQDLVGVQIFLYLGFVQQQANVAAVALVPAVEIHFRNGADHLHHKGCGQNVLHRLESTSFS